MLCMGENPLWVDVGEFQKLILFSDIRMEHCKIVSDRIQKRFEQKIAGEYQVDFDVTSIEDTDKKES